MAASAEKDDKRLQAVVHLPSHRHDRDVENWMATDGSTSMTTEATIDRPSLEGLVEAGWLKLESLHPGGLATSRELVERCGIERNWAVLDVASGTGETACLLADTFDARVWGVDRSRAMVRRARTKSDARTLPVSFTLADATGLPFADAAFDAAICECTLCLLDKKRVLREVIRVVRPGGCVGIHDLCWHEDAPRRVKDTLAEIEGERPETLEGWRQLFEEVGLVQVDTVDRSTVLLRWMRESRQQLGWLGQIGLTLKIIRRWGVRGAWTVWRSERVFTSQHLGYGLVVGTRPINEPTPPPRS